MYSTNYYSSIHCLHLPLDNIYIYNIHSFGRQKLKPLLCAVVLKLSWARFVSVAGRQEGWRLAVDCRFALLFWRDQKMQESGRFVQTLMIVALWLVLFVFITNHSTVATITQLLPCLTASQGRGIFQHCQGCHGVSRSLNWSIYSFWSSDEIHGWLGYRWLYYKIYIGIIS